MLPVSSVASDLGLLAHAHVLGSGDGLSAAELRLSPLGSETPAAERNDALPRSELREPAGMSLTEAPSHGPVDSAACPAVTSAPTGVATRQATSSGALDASAASRDA